VCCVVWVAYMPDGRTLLRPPAESYTGRYLVPESCTLQGRFFTQLNQSTNLLYYTA
jgi:hypothetical protein